MPRQRKPSEHWSIRRPVISIQMSTLSDEASTNADLVFSGPADFDAATKSILDELKRRGVLAHAIGAKPTFQYSI